MVIAGFLNTYDAENRLLTSTLGGVMTAYTYDGDGRRVQKATGASTTTYVYDAAGQLAAEYGAVATPPPCATCYLTADNLGSTRTVTDASGAVRSLTGCLPSGEEIQSGVGGQLAPYYPSDALAVADGVTQKLNGKERDVETGLDYFGARYLSSAPGRWTSPDWAAAPQPVPYASLGNPQSLNLRGCLFNNLFRGPDLDGPFVDMLLKPGRGLVNRGVDEAQMAGAD
jgi:RHS repeat-associated protein